MSQLTQRGISRKIPSACCCGRSRRSSSRSATSRRCAPPPIEGGGYVLLEFEAGFDSKSALADVRAKVDQAKRDLPRDADEPVVHGGQSLALSGAGGRACPATCRSARMLRIARNAKNAIEQVPGVLSAELRGARDEAVEIIVEPMLLQAATACRSTS